MCCRASVTASFCQLPLGHVIITLHQRILSTGASKNWRFQPLCVICTTKTCDGWRFGAADVCVPACEEELKMWIPTGVRRVMTEGGIVPLMTSQVILKGSFLELLPGPSLTFPASFSSIAAHPFSCVMSLMASVKFQMVKFYTQQRFLALAYKTELTKIQLSVPSRSAVLIIVTIFLSVRPAAWWQQNTRNK